jgi:predicted nucleic-acid-binding protein
MKGIDTNILIRFLVGDDDLQARQVYSLFKEAEADKAELFVPLLVILELIWVLESVYEIAREEILESIGDLLLMPILKFEQVAVLQKFMLHAQGTRYDLSDLLIGYSAKEQGCQGVITFDKKASASSLFELVK